LGFLSRGLFWHFPARAEFNLEKVPTTVREFWGGGGRGARNPEDGLVPSRGPQQFKKA